MQQESSPTAISPTPSPSVNPIESPISTPPEKKNVRLPILVLVFILLLVSSVIGFIYFVRRDTAKIHDQYLWNLAVYSTPSPVIMPYSASPRSTPSPIPIVYTYAKTLTDLPPLYPGFEWQLVDETYWRDLIGVIHIEDRDPNTFIGTARLKGQEWYFKKSNLDEAEFSKFIHSFDQYYIDKLAKIGWSPQTEIPGYFLQANMGDGPYGEMWGFVGTVEDKVRVIASNTRYSRSVFNPDSSPDPCPCSIEYWIFVSEITPLQRIVDIMVKE